jgi:hypothetical protein
VVFTCMKTVSHRGHRGHRGINDFSVFSVPSVAIHPYENVVIAVIIGLTFSVGEPQILMN